MPVVGRLTKRSSPPFDLKLALVWCDLVQFEAEPSPMTKPSNSPSKSTTPFPYESLSDCDRPACDDIASMFQKAALAATNEGRGRESEKATQSTTKLVDSRSNQVESAVAAESNPVDDSCPPSSAKLGRSTWTLLHSMAAWYPDKPTEAEQTGMKGFFAALGRFYPCPWCAQDFQQNIEAKPPETGSRKELCQWLCEQHNLVNLKLGKEPFPCDMSSLDERWRRSSKEECRKR